MNRKRVPLYGKTGSMTVEEGATKGATFGVDLMLDANRVLTFPLLVQAVSQALGTQSGGGSSAPERVIWQRVEQRPANIRALELLPGTGLFAVTGAGTGAFRTLQPVAGETTVADGDGVAGNPVVGLANVADSGVATALTRTAFDAKGRRTGTQAAVLADLSDVAPDAPDDDAVLAWDALTEAWTPRDNVLRVETITDAAYALSAADASTRLYLRFTDADAQITVQAEATEPMPQGAVITGRVAGALADLIEDTGVTIHLPAGGSLALVQGNRFQLVRVAADEWDLSVT